MCMAKPGPRCSPHARAALARAVSVGTTADVLLARDNYDETSEGQAILASNIDKARMRKKNVSELIARKEMAAARRVDKINRFNQLIAERAEKSKSSKLAEKNKAKEVLVDPTEEPTRRRVSPERARINAEKAARSYSSYIASFWDADQHEVERTILELKMDYARNYAHLSQDERPDPPQEWIESMSNSRGQSVSNLPIDPASRYAFYRVQFDPTVFAQDPDRRYAVLDVETAEEDWQGRPRPENGSIIEIGIVEYDAEGNKLSSWGKLIHPGEERAARIGTGAVDVHNITMDDVKDAPQWEEIAGDIKSRIENTTVIAHNSGFDSLYLGYHLYGERRLPQPVIDTLGVSRIHNTELPNHQLSTVAEKFGIVNENSHRAEFDALVCGEAFFAMKKDMKKQWEQSKCFQVISAQH